MSFSKTILLSVLFSVAFMYGRCQNTSAVDSIKQSLSKANTAEDKVYWLDILSRTIQGLPPTFRTVFVLRDVEGLSTEETAEALELSVPAVKSRLLRARLQLRERLNRYFQRKQGANVDGNGNDHHGEVNQ